MSRDSVAEYCLRQLQQERLYYPVWLTLCTSCARRQVKQISHFVVDSLTQTNVVSRVSRLKQRMCSRYLFIFNSRLKAPGTMTSDTAQQR